VYNDLEGHAPSWLHLASVISRDWKNTTDAMCCFGTCLYWPGEGWHGRLAAAEAQQHGRRL